MALPVIGSVFQSIRMMGLSMKWQQRKADSARLAPLPPSSSRMEPLPSENK